MAIGTGIFLLVVGAILTFAVGNNSKHTEVVERRSETHVDDRPAEPRDDVRRDQQPR